MQMVNHTIIYLYTYIRKNDRTPNCTVKMVRNSLEEEQLIAVSLGDTKLAVWRWTPHLASSHSKSENDNLIGPIGEKRHRRLPKEL